MRNRFTTKPQLRDLLPTREGQDESKYVRQVQEIQKREQEAADAVRRWCHKSVDREYDGSYIGQMVPVEPRSIPAPCADCHFWKTMTLVLSAAVIALAVLAERWVR